MQLVSTSKYSRYLFTFVLSPSHRENHTRSTVRAIGAPVSPFCPRAVKPSQRDTRHRFWVGRPLILAWHEDAAQNAEHFVGNPDGGDPVVCPNGFGDAALIGSQHAMPRWDVAGASAGNAFVMQAPREHLTLLPLPQSHHSLELHRSPRMLQVEQSNGTTLAVPARFSRTHRPRVERQSIRKYRFGASAG